MRLDIHASGFELTNALNEYIHRRCTFALSRFQGVVRRISVHVADVNGPKGGIDKSCVVCVKTDNMPELVVKDTESDLYVAVDRAIARSKHSLARRVKRVKALSAKHERVSSRPYDIVEAVESSLV